MKVKRVRMAGVFGFGIVLLLGISLAFASGGAGGGAGGPGGGSAGGGAQGGGAGGQSGGGGNTIQTRDRDRASDQNRDQLEDRTRDGTGDRLRTRERELDRELLFKDSGGEVHQWQERYNHKLQKYEAKDDPEGLARALHRVANRYRLSSEEDVGGFVDWALKNRPWTAEE